MDPQQHSVRTWCHMNRYMANVWLLKRGIRLAIDSRSGIGLTRRCSSCYCCVGWGSLCSVCYTGMAPWPIGDTRATNYVS
jgi:hypothetical protein